MILSTREVANAKVRRIQGGHSAFAESNETIRLMKKQLSRLNLEVQIDDNHFGTWFIPKKNAQKAYDPM